MDFELTEEQIEKVANRSISYITSYKAIAYEAQKELVKWLREHDNCAVMYKGRAFTLTLKDWVALIKYFELEGK